MKKIIFSLIFIVFIVASYAQVGSMFSNPSFAKPDFSFTSLFNPNILTMNHSVSFFSGMDSSKNGGMFGEAILFFDKKLAENFKYYRKQGMQLHSKMRYLSSQFAVMLTDELWRKNAAHANKMAKVLYEKVKKIPEITVTQKVETNGIFAIIPEDIIEKLQSEYFFYIWDEAKSEVRWMTSFDTTENDIANFVDKLINLLRKTLINSKVI